MRFKLIRFYRGSVSDREYFSAPRRSLWITVPAGVYLVYVLP